MNRREQKQLLRNLMNSIRDDLLKRSAKWPAEWDGHELRWLIVDATAYGALGSQPINKRDRRFREYQNTVITENLY
jgi:hypothetical protein